MKARSKRKKSSLKDLEAEWDELAEETRKEKKRRKQSKQGLRIEEEDADEAMI
jgi:hypothetical protein